MSAVDDIRILERVTHTRYWALSAVDALAAALHARGEFPPPVGDIACTIENATAPAPRSFEPPLSLTTFRGASGVFVLDGTYSRASEPARKWPLSAGTYTVRLRGDLYQDAVFSLDWPPALDQLRVPLDPADPAHPPANVLLMPGPAYPLPDLALTGFQLGPTVIRGTAVSPQGTPVVGVEVMAINLPLLPPPASTPTPPLAAWPFFRAVTGSNGDWAIVLPGRIYIDPAPELPAVNPPLAPLTKVIAVRMTYPGGLAITVNETVVLGTEHVMQNTAIRGQVRNAVGRPIAGARVGTSVNAEQVSSRDDGTWFLYFRPDQADVPSVTVTVTAPGGATASSATPLKHGATIVVPTFNFP